MKLKALLAIAVACMTVNATVQADGGGQLVRLITPTLWVELPDQFACNLTNVSGQTRNVRTRIISNGVVLLNSGVVQIEPMHIANEAIPGRPDPGGPVYCEFTVEGDKSWYRGAAKLWRLEPNFTDFLVIPAT